MWISLLICVLYLIYIDASILIRSWNVLSPTLKEFVEINLLYHEMYHIHVLFQNRTSFDCHTLFKVSESNHTSRMIHNWLGPDEIIVRLEGFTIQSTIPNYLGCNNYSTSFQIYEIGQYNLKIERLRNNYTAINEFHLTYPLIQYEIILDEIITLDRKIITNTCEKQWMAIQPNYMLSTAREFIEPQTFYRNMKLTTHIQLDSTDNNTKSCALKTDNYIWNYPCLNDNHNINNNNSNFMNNQTIILKNKRILMIGDSHVRHLIILLINHLCDYNMPTSKFAFNQYFPTEHTKCSNMTFSFVQQYECSLAGFSNEYVNYDIFALNCGHHLCDSDNHYSIIEYRNLIHLTINDVIQKGFTNKNFLWIENTAQPLRNDHWVVSKNDWRTQHRLYSFNRVINAMLLHLNITIIKTFQSTLALNDKLCDNAHYSHYSFLQPIFQQIISLLI